MYIIYWSFKKAEIHEEKLQNCGINSSTMTERYQLGLRLIQ